MENISNAEFNNCLDSISVCMNKLRNKVFNDTQLEKIIDAHKLDLIEQLILAHQSPSVEFMLKLYSSRIGDESDYIKIAINADYLMSHNYSRDYIKSRTLSLLNQLVDSGIDINSKSLIYYSEYIDWEKLTSLFILNRNKKLMDVLGFSKYSKLCDTLDPIFIYINKDKIDSDIFEKFSQPVITARW